MSQYKKIHQNKFTVSVPTKSMEEIAQNGSLSRKDLRVCLALLARLDGERYKMIDIESIAYMLNMTKKEVKNCLIDLQSEDIIVCGCDDYVSEGYKFKL